MKFSFISTKTLAVLFLLVLTSTLVWSQTETGQILGTVTDPSGAVVPGVNVSVTSLGKGFTRTVVTSGSGVYRITNLEPGPYEIKIEQPGFDTFKRRVDVTVGSRNTTDAKLAVKG